MNGDHNSPASMSTDRQLSTPGPWRASRHSSIVGTAVVANRGIVVASVLGDRDTAVANARLIAAAPDLLAIAKQCASECAGCSGVGTWARVTNVAGPAIREPCEDCADIRKVIDKAEGRS